MISIEQVVDARKKTLKDTGVQFWDEPHNTRWCKLSNQWSQCTFPRRGYPMEKDSKWRSKDDAGLIFFVRKHATEGFEKGDIMIKNPRKWYDWQLKALYIMYPDYKDVMQVLVKKHLADWGIPSSPLERGDMRNKEEAFINHLIRSSENEQSSFERMDSNISGGESKNQTDDEKPLLDTELKTLLLLQKTVDEDIDNLKQKLAKAEESSKKLKDKIKKKQKEQRKEEKRKKINDIEAEARKKINDIEAEARKKINEVAAEVERLKRLNEDEDSSDEEEELVEPDFPGAEEVEEFEHESLNQWDGVDFYKDNDDNVWDENKDFVGTYDDDDNTISFKEGYTPDENMVSEWNL